MSIIITTCAETGKNKFMILADDGRELITRMDLKDWIIEITGDAGSPKITHCRFVNCTIIAENLRIFESCWFDDSCDFSKVKILPTISRGISFKIALNNNAIRVEDDSTK